MLLDAPLDSHSLRGDSLPPPSLLKRKIIIKNKKKKKGENSSGSSDAETSPVVEAAPEKALSVVANINSSTDTPQPDGEPLSEGVLPEESPKEDTLREGAELENVSQLKDNSTVGIGSSEASDIPKETERGDADDQKETDEGILTDVSISDTTDKDGSIDKGQKEELPDNVTSPKSVKPSNGEVAQPQPAVTRQASKDSGDEDGE